METKLHNVTKIPPKRFVLTVGNFGAESDCIGSLDFTGVSGKVVWTVHAVYAGRDGSPDWRACIVCVDPDGFMDRSGRIKSLVCAWLQRLERLQGLCAVCTEYDGGSDSVEVPMFVVSND